MKAYVVNYFVSKKVSDQGSVVIYAGSAEEAKQKFDKTRDERLNYTMISVIPAIRPHPITPEQMEYLISNCNTVTASTKRALETLTTTASLLTRMACDMGMSVVVDKQSGEILIDDFSNKGSSI